MLRSIGKQSGESMESVLEKKEGYGRKDLQKRNVLSLEWKSEGLIDHEGGESMEPMEKVPLKELGESEMERLVRGWRREARDEGKHTGRNGLFFVEKMMWMGEQVWPKIKSECCEEAELWWGYADNYEVCKVG